MIRYSFVLDDVLYRPTLAVVDIATRWVEARRGAGMVMTMMMKVGGSGKVERSK